MTSSDKHKPATVKERVWQQHLEWMRVMESSRHHAQPMKQLMDQYFLPPDEDTGEDTQKGADSPEARSPNQDKNG